MSQLYLNHFGLQQPPFDLTPNPDFFYAGGQRGELLAALAFAVLDTPGIVVVVGEVGSGKTMLCRMLAQRLQQQGHDLIYLDNPAFSPSEILHSIAADWGLTPEPGVALHVQIQRQLLQRHAQGRKVVLLIDEAQAMPPASLEEVRLLSNLESATDKLLRIVLFGQPELDDKLRSPALRQLRDRVVHCFDIPPLSPSDAAHYLHHRLRCAGCRGAPLMTEPALRAIVRAAGGRLRALNQLAERALLAAFAAGSRRVEPVHVRAALRDQQRTWPNRAPPGWRTAAALAAVGSGGVTLAIAWVLWGSGTAADSPPVPAPTSATPAAAAAAEREVPSPSATAAATVPALPVTAPSGHLVADKDPPPPAARRDARPALAATPTAWPADVLQRRDAMLALLADPQQNGYVLQLATGPQPQVLLDRLQRHGLQQPVWVLERYYPPGTTVPVWAVFVGHYPDRASAQAALAALPEALRRDGPQVRSLAALRAEPQPERLPGS